MKSFPDFKGMCLSKDEASSLCNALNFFDDGIEKNDFNILPEYRNENILLFNYTWDSSSFQYLRFKLNI